MAGLFITFEGIDSSGKTTQAELLVKALRERGYDVVFTHEPGGTEIAEKIRDLLLSEDNNRMTWLTELFLYMASRAQHTEEVINRSMEEDKIVVCDRYMDSTLAYQGYGRGLDRNLIRKLNHLSTRGLKPRLTFLIDLPPKAALERREGGDRLESETLEFHNRVREGYLEIAKDEPQRFRLIDGTRPVQEIAREILKVVEGHLRGKFNQ